VLPETCIRHTELLTEEFVSLLAEHSHSTVPRFTTCFQAVRYAIKTPCSLSSSLRVNHGLAIPIQGNYGSDSMDCTRRVRHYPT